MSNNQIFRNFGDVTRHLAATQPDRVALTFEGRDTTYGEFERYTNRVAAALLASGVKKGERVAYFGKNSDRYLEIFFGAAKVGAVTTPINWRLAGPELAYILQDSRAPILFVGEEFGDTVEQVAGDCPCLKTIVDMDAHGNRPVFREWRDAQAETAPASDVGRDDDVLQLYTSGTTGRPKGAMLMARNLLDLQDMMHRIDGEWARWSPDDISLIAMPIGHIGGTGWAFWTLFHGAKGIVVRDFDPNRVLDFIEHDKVNKLFIVPSALQIVVSQPRARRIDYSHLKYISYGASPIPLALLREWRGSVRLRFCSDVRDDGNDGHRCRTAA
jgi:acyl-CoA synthetase (AMP-forming)/AMP-acid ligase II